MSRTTPSRRDLFGIFSEMAAKGYGEQYIAKAIGRPVVFVRQMAEVAGWPEGRRNAWLLGLNTGKFQCV